MSLTKHDLLPFGVFQIDKPFLLSAVSNLKSDDILPKGKAGVQVTYMKLRHHSGPPRFWGSVAIATHASLSG
jgi:hypothetical protein